MSKILGLGVAVILLTVGLGGTKNFTGQPILVLEPKGIQNLPSMWMLGSVTKSQAKQPLHCDEEYNFCFSPLHWVTKNQFTEILNCQCNITMRKCEANTCARNAVELSVTWR